MVRLIERHRPDVILIEACLLAGWVRDLGWWGPVVFVIVYALACLIIPGSVLSLGAGFAFGVVLGTVAVSLGSVSITSSIGT